MKYTMKALKQFINFLFILLFLIPFQLQAQNVLSREKLEKVANEIMINATSCALITIDSQGQPRVRAMDPFAPETDFTIWFGTNKNSRKVGQIQHDNRVTLYYIDPDLSGYVTIIGTALIIDDLDAKKKYWKDAWNDFYLEDRKDYSLIKVSPLWMEVISTKHDVLGDTVSWEPPKVEF